MGRCSAWWVPSVQRPMRSRWVADAALAAAVAVPTCLDAWWNVAGSRQADWLSYALVGVPAGALVVRRRWPLAVAAVCAGALVTWYAIGHRGVLTALPAMVALYTVAAQGHRRLTVAVGCGTVGVAVVLAVLVGDAGLPVDELGLPIAALLLGEAVRGHRDLLAEQAARADHERREREAQARRQAQEERLHLARELHDIVAHTVAAMNVQASVAIDAFESNPAVARQALSRMRALGRGAVTELRATLSVLRDDTARAARAPVPGLADIAPLADSLRSGTTTIGVTCDVDGDAVPLGVQHAAYRIVQEALTNVLRHADATRAEVHVRPAGDDALVVEVTDDGRGHVDGHSPGLGLTGIVERAESVGGTVEWGPRGVGGFRVCAVLPARSSSAVPPP